MHSEIVSLVLSAGALVIIGIILLVTIDTIIAEWKEDDE